MATHQLMEVHAPTTEGGSPLLTSAAEGDLRGVWRRKWLVVVTTLVAAGVALGLSLSQVKQYSATVDLLIRNPRFDEQLFGARASGVPNPARDVATAVSLASSPVVAADASRQLGGRLTPDEITDMVKLDSGADADIVTVTATDHDPKLAADVATTYGREYVDFRVAADRQKIAVAQRSVERRLAALSPSERRGRVGRNLEQGAQQLATLSSLQTGNAELVAPAKVPEAPSSPRVKLNTAIGGFLGLVLGLLLAVGLTRADRRVKDPEDLAELYGVPLVGAIPESRSISRGGAHATAFEREAFLMLRSRLKYFNVDRQTKTLLIDSSQSGDGKSTVAWYLALSLAQGASGSRVVLVEADFRRPNVAIQRGLEMGPGLADLLAGDASFEAVQQRVDVALEGGQSVGLTVITTGAMTPDPAGLLESRRMAETLMRLREEFDVVVIDAPPTGVVPDAIPLLRLVDGVLVVGNMEKTSRDAAERLRRQFENIEAPVLGVVANRVRRQADNYSYGYGHRD